jgi:two-component sensor histidine kinase
VKNNLQIIISLLNLQSDYIKDEQTLKAVTDGQNRVRSMALVHEKFYQAAKVTENQLSKIIQRSSAVFCISRMAMEAKKIQVHVKSDPGYCLRHGYCICHADC